MRCFLTKEGQNYDFSTAVNCFVSALLESSAQDIFFSLICIFCGAVFHCLFSSQFF